MILKSKLHAIEPSCFQGELSDVHARFIRGTVRSVPALCGSVVHGAGAGLDVGADGADSRADSLWTAGFRLDLTSSARSRCTY